MHLVIRSIQSDRIVTIRPISERSKHINQLVRIKGIRAVWNSVLSPNIIVVLKHGLEDRRMFGYSRCRTSAFVPN